MARPLYAHQMAGNCTSDLRIAERLGVPVSLFRALSTAHGGPETARKTVYRWQRTVLDSVTAVLSESIPAPSSKPNPFTPSDWNDSHRPLRDPCVVIAPRQTPPPAPHRQPHVTVSTDFVSGGLKSGPKPALPHSLALK